MELHIEPLKHWQSSVGTLEESPPIDPSTIKLAPSYLASIKQILNL
jgi:hypothetical protein